MYTEYFASIVPACGHCTAALNALAKKTNRIKGKPFTDTFSIHFLKKHARYVEMKQIVQSIIMGSFHPVYVQTLSQLHSLWPSTSMFHIKSGFHTVSEISLHSSDKLVHFLDMKMLPLQISSRMLLEEQNPFMYNTRGIQNRHTQQFGRSIEDIINTVAACACGK